MFDRIHEMIENHLELMWGGVTPIAWDNVEYVPRRGVEFIRPTITFTSNNLTSGTTFEGNYRIRGLLTIQVFTPANDGARYNLEIAAILYLSFMGTHEDRLFYEPAYTVRVGVEKEWYHTNVMIPFYFDDCIMFPGQEPRQELIKTLKARRQDERSKS